MIPKEKLSKIFGASVITLLLFVTIATTVTGSFNEKTQLEIQPEKPMLPSAGGSYDGHLRVYLVEPESRWNDYSGKPYHFAHLDWAIDTSISIPYLESYNEIVTWDASQNGWSNVEDRNIMATAVVFNGEGHPADSQDEPGYPPAPFTAYYSDATAAANPGETAYNIAEGDYTHTVFVEKGTASWCPSCPAANTAFSNIYKTGTYNFEYVAMVIDKNTQANNRMNYYNLYWVPTSYFDAGYYVMSGSSTSGITSRIIGAGQREVPNLNLTLSFEWLGGDEYQIEVNVTNNQYQNTAPDTPSILPGIYTGGRGMEYIFTATTSDTEDDQVYYMWDWGNGEYSDWLGSFEPDTLALANYTWDDAGNYDVKVKSKDAADLESDWSDPMNIDIIWCGDANSDGNPNVGDAVYLIAYIFNNGPAPLPEICAGDANADGSVNVGDAVFLINYIFSSGPEPYGCCSQI